MRINVLKSGFFTLAVVCILGMISIFFGYVFVLQHDSSNVGVTTSPHVFYSALKVTKIDDAGNVQGITSVYRVDGMNGQPKLVTVLQGETFQQQIDFQSQSLRYDVVATHDLEISKFPVTLDGQGNDISSSVRSTGSANTKDAVLSHFQWIHPHGTYATASDIYCTDTPVEGPCAQSYRMMITNLATNQKKELLPKDFGGIDGQWVARPLQEISKTTALVALEAMQERLTAFVGILDFVSGTIKPLHMVDTSYQGEIAGKEFLRLSDDLQSGYFIDRIATETQQPAIVAMDLTMGEFSLITTNVRGENIYWPKEANYILFDNSYGTRVVRRDLKSGKEVVVATSSLDAYLHPVRFTVSTETSTAGISGGKLLLKDSVTGHERTIFDQKQESNAYGPNVNKGGPSKNAKIGSIVYQFIGIDQ